MLLLLFVAPGACTLCSWDPMSAVSESTRSCPFVVLTLAAQSSSWTQDRLQSLWSGACPYILPSPPPRRHTLLLSIFTPLNWGPELKVPHQRGATTVSWCIRNLAWVLSPQRWLGVVFCFVAGCMIWTCVGLFAFRSCLVGKKKGRRMVGCMVIFLSDNFLKDKATRHHFTQSTRPTTTGNTIRI